MLLCNPIGQILINQEFSNLDEDIINVLSCLGTHLHKWNIMLIGQGLSLPILNYSIVGQI